MTELCQKSPKQGKNPTRLIHKYTKLFYVPYKKRILLHMKKEPTLIHKQEKKAYKYEDNVGYQVFMCFQVMIIIDIAHGFVETNLSKYNNRKLKTVK